MLGALQNVFREPAFLPKGGDALRPLIAFRKRHDGGS